MNPLLRGPDLEIPFIGARVCAGFPSPADDHLEEAIDPARMLVVNEAATFMMRVSGTSMIEAGIRDGDWIVVDRSLAPQADDVVVAVIDGLLSLKRVIRRRGRIVLDFANGSLPALEIDEFSEVEVWGVVTWSMVRHRVIRP